MKKIILFLILLILIFLGYFTFFYKTVEAPKLEKNNEDKVIKTSIVSTSTKEISKDFYNVKFVFPITDNQKINSEINKQVELIVYDFEKDALEFGPLPSDIERPYTLFADFESYLYEEYKNFVFLISVDFGGAHPNHFYKTLTFDKDDNVILLEQFLSSKFSNIDYLSKISELSRNKLKLKLGPDLNLEMLENGTEPKLENFRNFYITDSEIVFLFEPYAVAPYSSSNQEARISFSEIF